MTKTKRTPVGTKLRFEVLKRDKFMCRYCGASGSDTRLEIDHIIPVYEGGTSDIENLVTACKNCNIGKGKRKLSNKDVMKMSHKQLADSAELLEQLQEMAKWRVEIANMKNSEIDTVIETIEKVHGVKNVVTIRGDIEKVYRKYGFEKTVDKFGDYIGILRWRENNNKPDITYLHYMNIEEQKSTVAGRRKYFLGCVRNIFGVSELYLTIDTLDANQWLDVDDYTQLTKWFIDNKQSMTWDNYNDFIKGYLGSITTKIFESFDQQK